MWLITFLLAIAALRISGNSYGLFNPAKIFAFVWSIQILMAICIFNNFLILEYKGLVFILICVILFYVGYTVGFNLYVKKLYSSYNTNNVNKGLLYSIVIILFILSFANQVIAVYQHGFNLVTLLDFNMLLDMNNQISIDRYTNDRSNSSVFLHMMLVFSFLLPLVGGYAYNILDGKEKKICIIAILPGVFGVLTQGAKMGLITSSMLWIIGWTLCYTTTDTQFKYNIKKIISVIVLIVILFSLLFISMMFRIGTFDVATAEVVTNKFSTYSLGHISAFDQWYTYVDEDYINHTYGMKTLYGFSNALGLLKREQGVFTDLIQISTLGGSTNVYSLFRILIEDFGSIGTLAFMIIIGFINGRSYKMLLCSRYIFLNITFQAISLFCILWSFVTTALAYTSYIAMIVFFYYTVRITYRKYATIR